MRPTFGVKLTTLAIASLALVANTPQPAEGQFFNALANLFRPITRAFSPRFRDDGTRSPQATGIDKVLPSDCGRDPDKGTGKLCFPDGLLCQQSKFLSYVFQLLMICYGWYYQGSRYEFKLRIC